MSGSAASSEIFDLRRGVLRPMARRRRTFTALLALCSALALPVAAQNALSGTGELEVVVRKVIEQQRRTDTIQADFKQEKVMALLAKPEASTGSFVYSKPNQVLWTYDAPKRVTVLISGGYLTTYYPDLNKAEQFEVKRYQDRIFKYMGASGGLDELGQYFDFTFTDNAASSTYLLDLTPKSKTVAKRIRRLKIWIDRTSYLTTRLEYVEGDGDITRYEFSNIKINQPVAQSRFALNLPPSVRLEQLKLN
jgi:outer membrane lipoprotein-sorting protein